MKNDEKVYMQLKNPNMTKQRKMEVYYKRLMKLANNL